MCCKMTQNIIYQKIIINNMHGVAKMLVWILVYVPADKPYLCVRIEIIVLKLLQI